MVTRSEPVTFHANNTLRDRGHLTATRRRKNKGKRRAVRRHGKHGGTQSRRSTQTRGDPTSRGRPTGDHIVELSDTDSDTDSATDRNTTTTKRWCKQRTTRAPSHSDTSSEAEEPKSPVSRQPKGGLPGCPTVYRGSTDEPLATLDGPTEQATGPDPQEQCRSNSSGSSNKARPPWRR